MAVARRELGLIGHTMALEDQAVSDEEDEKRLRQFVADELDPARASRPGKSRFDKQDESLRDLLQLGPGE
jgi:hypothetical protein